MFKYAIALVALCSLCSCNPSQEQPPVATTQHDSIVATVKPTLAGKVYFYAPQLDSLTCSAIGECDCCSGHFVFLNDSDFVWIAYCESNAWYRKGLYHFKDDHLAIVTDKLVVEREHNPALEMDTVAANAGPEYLVTDTLLKPFSYTLKNLYCKNGHGFLMDENDGTYYVTYDRNTRISTLVDTMKAQGVWERLKMKN